MEKNEIRGLLITHKIKQTDIARQLGVVPTTVSEVVARRQNSRRVQEFIAMAVGMEFEEIWGNNEQEVII